MHKLKVKNLSDHFECATDKPLKTKYINPQGRFTEKKKQGSRKK